jgi:hypothetical protein
MADVDILVEKVNSHLEDLTEKMTALHAKITRLEFGLLFTIVLMFLLFIFRIHR